MPVFAHAAGSQQLQGHVPAVVANSPLLRDANDQEVFHLVIGLPLRNQEALESLIKNLYDPKSSQYRRYLSPQLFTSMFGPTNEDYQKLIDFAKTNGMSITKTSPNQTLLDVTVTAADIRRVFHTRLHYYSRPDGTEFYAPDSEPSVDLDLPILHISGLDNYSMPHNNMKLKGPIGRKGILASTPIKTSPSTGTGPDGFYWGFDYRNVYACGNTPTGTGQNIALFELDDYKANNITQYETYTGIGSPSLTKVVVTTPFAAPGAGEGEVELDIEMAMSMAPGAAVYVYENNGIPFITYADIDDLLNAIANPPGSNPLCQEISSSWTWNGSLDTNVPPIFLQYAAQGQSYFQAAGDDGAYTAVDPVPTPEMPINETDLMTVTGGTVLTTTGTGGVLGTYQGETTWNNAADKPAATATPASNAVGGGGICPGLSIPFYQTGTSMSANDGSTTNRDIPDVSMIADDLVIYTNGYAGNGLYVSGGTSAAAPLWAAFIALANEQDGFSMGFVNPAIYAIGNNPAQYPLDFHDINDGSDNQYWNNNPACSTCIYKAVTGYDLATGWGSPKCHLITDLGTQPTFAIPTNTPTNTSTNTPTETPTLTSTDTQTYTEANTAIQTLTNTSTTTPTNTATLTPITTPSATCNGCAQFVREWNTYPGSSAIASYGTTVYTGSYWETADNGVQVFLGGALINSFVEDTLDATSGIGINQATGNVYISNNPPEGFPDGDTNTIREFSSSGTFIRSWGGTGTGNGQFNFPSGVAVNSSTGNVYVLDGSNSRIQEFNSTGGFVTAWGSLGTAPGQFGQDSGINEIAVDGVGNVYVDDAQNHRIEEFNSTGTILLNNWSGITGSVGQGIAVDSSNNVWLTDTVHDSVDKYTNNGTLLCQITTFNGTQTFQDPEQLTFDSVGNLYVTDIGQGSAIEEFSPCNLPTITPTPTFTPTVTGTNCTFQPAQTFGTTGTALGQFETPFDVAVDPTGLIYVPDALNRITEWSALPSPAPISTWPLAGSGTYHLVADSKYLYVSSQGNSTIQIYNIPSGTLFTTFGSAGSGLGQFNTLWGIAVDGSGNVYAVDNGHNRIEKFSLPGYTPSILIQGTGSGAAGDLTSPLGLAVDSQGNLYVSEEITSNERVEKFNSAGVFQNVITNGFGSGAGQLGGLTFDVAVDGCNRVYVEDDTNKRVLVFGSGGSPFLTSMPFAAGSGTVYGIGTDNKANLYAALTTLNEVEVFSPQACLACTPGSITPTMTNTPTLTATNTASSTAANSPTATVTNTVTDTPTQTPTYTPSNTPTSTPATTICSQVSNIPVTDDFDGDIVEDSNQNFYVTAFHAGIAGSNPPYSTLQKLNSSGGVIAQWQLASTGLGGYLAIDSSNNIYVAEGSVNEKYTSAGVLVDQFTLSGSTSGSSGIAILGNVVYVLYDGSPNEVAEFDLIGNLIKTISIPNGSLAGQVSLGHGVAVDHLGNIYIAELNNERVSEFDPNGNFIRFIVPTGGLLNVYNPSGYTPFDVAVGYWGGQELVFVNADNNYVPTILAYTTAGQFVGSFPVNAPFGLNVAYGCLQVADMGNNSSILPSIDIFCPCGGSLTPTNTLTATPTNSPTATATNTPTITPTITPTNTPTSTVLACCAQPVTLWGSSGSGPGQFFNPNGVAADPNFVYVADQGNNRIQKFDPNGNFVLQWGSGGTGNGQLIGPRDLALDSTGGFVYVTDSVNNRIQKFTTSGGYITQFNAGGTLNFPYGVAVNSAGTTIYVTDNLNSRVVFFSNGGVLLGSWGTSGGGNGQFLNPLGISVDENGDVYVCDAGNNRIQKFSSSGTFLFAFAAVNCVGIGADQHGRVFVQESGSSSQVQIFNLNGTFICQFNGGVNPFTNAQDIAVDGLGNIYVADTFNQRIQKFFLCGIPSITLTPTSTATNTPTQTSTNTYTPIPTCVGSQALIVFAGSGTSGNANGSTLLASFGTPAGVAVDGSGDVYVADQSNNSIRKVSGGIVSTLVTGLSGGPVGIVYDAVSNSLYVSEYSPGRLDKINLTGTPAVTTVETGSGFLGICVGTNALGHHCIYYTTVAPPYAIMQYDTATPASSGLVAGDGVYSDTGDGGPATSAGLAYPIGVAFDSSRGTSGLLYIADQVNNNVRVVNVATGIINMVAGTGTQVAATPPLTTPALSVNLNVVNNLGIDPTTGNVYVIEGAGEVLEVLIPSTAPGLTQPPVNSYVMQRLAGTKNTAGYESNPIPPLNGNFNNPFGVVRDGSGNIYIGDQSNHVVREIVNCFVYPTIIPTVTSTNTPTQTITYTPANTATNTASNTVTSTATHTSTNTVTYTLTNTATSTATHTETRTLTDTPTNTATHTATHTETSTPTHTETRTSTNTRTNTATHTATRTETSTPTNTESRTRTNTPTNTGTRTATHTETSTPTHTETRTPTTTRTNTATHTATHTATSTPTRTETHTPTATRTNTTTHIATRTETFTSTHTETGTPTNTVTNTPTETSPETVTRTATNTPTLTSTSTATNTPTETMTNTLVNTAINTPTTTATNTPTATPTITNSLCNLISATLSFALDDAGEAFINGNLVSTCPNGCWTGTGTTNIAIPISWINASGDNVLAVYAYATDTDFSGATWLLTLNYASGSPTYVSPGTCVLDQKLNNPNSATGLPPASSFPSNWNALPFNDSSWVTPGVIGPLPPAGVLDETLPYPLGGNVPWTWGVPNWVTVGIGDGYMFREHFQTCVTSCPPTNPTSTLTNTPTNTATSTFTNTVVNTATNTPTPTVTNTPTATATNTPVNTCVAYTGPKLNLQVACNSTGAQEQQFGARIYNYGTAPITLSNMSIVTWLYESGPEDMDAFAASAGQTCGPGGMNCGNVFVSNTSTSHGAVPVCAAIPGHFANQSVTFTFGAADTVIIPPNGGYWQSQGNIFQFGRNNPQMDNGNWVDDYSHLGNGSNCPDNNFHDSPYYALFYNGQLVQEVTDINGDIDPNTGEIPCTASTYCMTSPVNTSTLTLTSTNTPTETVTNTPTKTPTSSVTNTATNTVTNTSTATSTNTETNSATNTALKTATNTSTNTNTDTATNTLTSTPTNTATSTSTNTATPTAGLATGPCNTMWYLNGSASAGNGAVTLTPNLAAQAGSAWNSNQLNLSSNFDLTFMVYLGSTATGSDGIGFVLQSQGTNALGGSGGGLGFGNVNGSPIMPSVDVEIDTHQNVELGDPPYDHIGVDENGNLNNAYLAGPVQASATIANIKDGALHTFEVAWNASTQILTIYFDGSQRLIFNQNMVSAVFGGNPNVYWGFAGGTGGGTELQYFVPLCSTPTSTYTNTQTNTPTNTATNTATNTPTVTATSTATNSATDTAVNTAMNTSTNTSTDTATNTPTVTATGTATNTASSTPNSGNCANFNVGSGEIPMAVSYVNSSMTLITGPAVNVPSSNYFTNSWPNPIAGTTWIGINASGTDNGVVPTYYTYTGTFQATSTLSSYMIEATADDQVVTIGINSCTFAVNPGNFAKPNIGSLTLPPSCLNTSGSNTLTIVVEDTELLYTGLDFTILCNPMPPTATATNTATNTFTNTATNTPTNTPTVTSTSTATNTTTNTSTNTSTDTATNTPTVTVSNTATNSATNTAVNTPTNTSTNSATNTATNTPTVTTTNTSTNTSTNTATNTATVTATSTATNTATNTAVNTATNTSTHTATNTATNTSTVSTTNTASNTAVNTATNTSTNTVTNTATNTATVTVTNTATNTASKTAVNTTTNTSTNTVTITPTITATNTPTLTSTNTALNTATDTSTNTSTSTPTATSTSTATNTPLNTATNTSTYTSTSTATNTPTATATNTATSTATNTALNTATNTPTNTSTNTGTSTPVPTSTNTPTSTSTNTATTSATSTVTNTPTCQAVQTIIYNSPADSVTYLTSSSGEPAGWQNVGFNASGWPAASNVTGTFSPYNLSIPYSSYSSTATSTGSDEILALTNFNVPASAFSVQINVQVKGDLSLWLNGSLLTSSGNSYSNDLAGTAVTGNNVLAIKAASTSSTQKLEYAHEIIIQYCQNYPNLSPSAARLVKSQVVFIEGNPTATNTVVPKTPTPSATPTLTPTVTSTITATPTASGLLLSAVAGPNISRNDEPIKFMINLGGNARVQLNLYSLMGEEVFTDTIDGNAGLNTIDWLVRNKAQAPVASGLYIYTIQVNNGYETVTKTGKVLVFH